ncbi:MAG: M23 family metallopeptidase [Sphingorhabdus sp.]
MRKVQGSITLALLLLAVTGCIPQSGDYRIKSSQRPSAENPQIVPEKQVILQTPNWQPAMVERNSRAVNAGVYIVQPGDTLYRIVSKTGASLADIAAANSLAPPYLLRAGQQLQIPSGLYHNVNAGETGIAIARAYQVQWSDVVALNNLDEPFVLQIGQRLRLPASAAAAPPSGDMTPEQRAAAFSLNIDDVVTGGEPATLRAGPAAPVSLSSPISRPVSFGGNFAWPLSGRLLSSFGSKGGGKVNDGINIAAGKGTPVGAAGNGVVVYSGNEIGVFGGLVLIDHGSGWVTAYGHLGQLEVARGDKVKAGQALGSVGDTGYVSSPQLHFEIRKDRKPLNPITKLPAR